MGGGSAGAGPAGDPAAGLTVYNLKGCSACHGNTGEGTLGPNITGSVSAGIGSWDEATFIRALKQGLDKNGQPFCSNMTAYPDLTDVELRNLFAYLRSVTNDTAQRGVLCP